jgi:hypothetical protein
MWRNKILTSLEHLRNFWINPKIINSNIQRNQIICKNKPASKYTFLIEIGNSSVGDLKFAFKVMEM